MKKRVISFILCGMMLMPMNVMASELPAVESESISIIEETETATEVVETEFITEAVIETVETELITEAVISGVETELITERVETELVTEAVEIEVATESVPESYSSSIEEYSNKGITEAQVGDIFTTYFGEYQVLSVGERPTAALVDDQKVDYDGNFWYGDPSKPWVVKYANMSFDVTRIECFISGNEVRIPEGVEYIKNQSFGGVK